ncbi:type 2 glycosyltransferase [Physcia stellaris]|nr:type 2 glycosyltransferase [Physcia stellaris]
MMHPSRQAYVEEEPEVSQCIFPPPKALCSNVHTTTSEGRVSSAWDTWYRDSSEGRRLMGWLEEIGHGDGGGSGEHTFLAIDRDYDLPSSTAGIAPEKASAILNQFQRKRRAAAIAVPTDDGRKVPAIEETDYENSLQYKPSSKKDPTATCKWGKAALRPQSDRAVLPPRAKARIQSQKLESAIPLRTHIKHRKALKDRLQNFDLFGTQIAGERPISLVRFSPNGQLIAAGNWGGGVKLLDVPNLDTKSTLRGHTDRVGGISWYPTSTLPTSTVSPSSVNLATSGGEGKIHLWSLDSDTPLSTLSGHTDRVARIEFHPSGSYLASASSDTTWRLWDVATTTELLLQEGHSREVYALAFNTDGSLLASAGLDSIGRIWDLRTGRTVMILDGHIRAIHALDWGTDGHRVLSGSADGWVKCWDVRSVKCVNSFGAHRSVVSDLRWFKGVDGPVDGSQQEQELGGARPDQMKPKKAGTFFVSSGFDKEVNVFSADDWAKVKSLSGHSGNVLGCDVSRDGKWIASCGHDRTVKLWGMDDGGGV